MARTVSNFSLRDLEYATKRRNRAPKNRIFIPNIFQREYRNGNFFDFDQDYLVHQKYRGSMIFFCSLEYRSVTKPNRLTMDVDPFCEFGLAQAWPPLLIIRGWTRAVVYQHLVRLFALLRQRQRELNRLIASRILRWNRAFR